MHILIFSLFCVVLNNWIFIEFNNSYCLGIDIHLVMYFVPELYYFPEQNLYINVFNFTSKNILHVILILCFHKIIN